MTTIGAAGDTLATVARGTKTSRFGVGRRENHDASAFYEQFAAPVISDDEEIRACAISDRLFVGDARDMSAVASKSVALVVTSPPYFAGKDYEAALGTGHVPASYVDYLKMLGDVFAESARVLEPGGRIAVNVANLGRKPYRSLAGDVTRILQDHLGLLLRGELVWIKGAGANGSCAWGSYASAANPVLRDVTERVVIASKGRFGRAVIAPEAPRPGLAVGELHHARAVPGLDDRHVAHRTGAGHAGGASGPASRWSCPGGSSSC